MVEHFTDNEKVEGSIPSTRTTSLRWSFAVQAPSAPMELRGVGTKMRAHMFTLNSLPFVEVGPRREIRLRLYEKKEARSLGGVYLEDCRRARDDKVLLWVAKFSVRHYDDFHMRD